MYSCAQPDSAVTDKGAYFALDSPATAERIRMACRDQFTARFTEEDYRPKGSW